MVKIIDLFTEIVDEILGSKYIRPDNYTLEAADGSSESFGQNLFKQRIDNNSKAPINSTTRDALTSCMRYKFKLNRNNKGNVIEANAIETANKLCDFFDNNSLFDCSELRNSRIFTEDPSNKHKRELLLSLFHVFLDECVDKELIDTKKTASSLVEAFVLLTATVTADIVSNNNYDNKPSAERLERLYQKGYFSISSDTNLTPKTRIPQPAPFFVGRTNELSAIQDSIINRGYAILEGVPGIGKSELAKKYISNNKNNYESILWLNYEESIEYTFYKTRFPFDEFHKGESVEDAYIRKIEKLVVQNIKTLIVIDNCDKLPFKDNMLDEFLTYEFDVLLTTRLSFDDSIKIENIQDKDELYKLFTYFCSKYSSPDYKAEILELIDTLQSHTLLVELYAKLLERSELTLTKATKLAKNNVIISNETNIRIKKDDKTISNRLQEHISSLLNLNELQNTIDVTKQYYLTIAAFIPMCGFPVEDVHKLCQHPNNNSLYELNDLGWISIKNNIVSVHPLVRDALLNNSINNSEIIVGIVNKIKSTTGMDDITGKIYTNPKIPYYCELVYNVFTKLYFSSDSWFSFCNLGMVFLYEAGYGKNALSMFETTKRQSLIHNRTDSINFPVLLCYGANICQHLGYYDRAFDELTHCISIIENNSSFKQNTHLVDECYSNLAQLYVDRGDIATAKDIFDKEISGNYKNQDSTYADILFYTDHKEEEIVRRNIMNSFQHEKSKYYAEQAAKLANCLGKQGLYDECLMWHEKAYETLVEIGFINTPDIADALYSHAVSLCDAKQHQLAVNKLLKSFEIYSKDTENYRTNLIDVEYMLAEAYAQLEDYTNAKLFIFKCLENQEYLLAQNPSYINSNYANQLFFAGTLFKEDNDYSSAICHYTKCEEVYEKLQNKSAIYFLEYQLHSNAALCFYQCYQHEKAAFQIEKALMCKSFSDEKDDLIQLLILLEILVDCLSKCDKFDQAYEKAKYALSIWKTYESVFLSVATKETIPTKFSFLHSQFLCCLYNSTESDLTNSIAQEAIDSVDDYIITRHFEEYKSLLTLWGAYLVSNNNYNKGFKITKMYLELVDIENDKSEFTYIAVATMIHYFNYKKDNEKLSYFKAIQDQLINYREKIAQNFSTPH